MRAASRFPPRSSRSSRALPDESLDERANRPSRRAAAQRRARARSHVPAHFRDGGGGDRGRLRLRRLGIPDALRRRRVHAVRSRLAARRAPGRPLGKTADDARLLLRNGRFDAARGRHAQCMGARGGADADGRILVDLPSRRHPDAGPRRDAPGPRDRRQWSRRKSGRGAGRRDDRAPRQIRRLARGVRGAGVPRDRLRRALRPRRAARARRRLRMVRGRPPRRALRRSRASSRS